MFIFSRFHEATGKKKLLIISMEVLGMKVDLSTIVEDLRLTSVYKSKEMSKNRLTRLKWHLTYVRKHLKILSCKMLNCKGNSKT